MTKRFAKFLDVGEGGVNIYTMTDTAKLDLIIERLDAFDAKLGGTLRGRQKSMEWIATLSEQIESLDEFREEVRASFEPLLRKLDNLDEVMRIMRHATSDIGRRVELLEKKQRQQRLAS